MILFMRNVTLFIAALAAFVQPVMADNQVSNVPMEKGKYSNNWQSLQQWDCPEWFKDAKFGLWAHWGPQCQAESGDWYARFMYYSDSPYDEHRGIHYNPAEYGLKEFCRDWKAEKWNPEAIMEKYAKVGCKYFMALGNHHDNFDLWNSPYQVWNSVNIGPKKDLIKGWEEAARKNGLKFGVSIHASHAWTWLEPSQKYDGNLTKKDGKGLWWEDYDPQELYAQCHPHSTGWENSGTIHSQWDWGNGASLPSEAYKLKLQNRCRQLINDYNPDMIYFDDTVLPFWGCDEQWGPDFLAHYYNYSANHSANGKADVVVCGKILPDTQKEAMLWDVERGIPDRPQEKYWQTCTCIGDWHYSLSKYHNGGYKSAATVIRMLVDIVSKNGNLLLSIPLRADGTYDEKEEAILDDIQAWMEINGESIYGTRVWKCFGEGPLAEAVNGMTAQGFNEGQNYTSKDVRYVTKDGKIYATIMAWPNSGKYTLKAFSPLSGYNVGKVSSVYLLGYGEVKFAQTVQGLVIDIPATHPNEIAPAFRITTVENSRSEYDKLQEIIKELEPLCEQYRQNSSLVNTGAYNTEKVEALAEKIEKAKMVGANDDAAIEEAKKTIAEAYQDLEKNGINKGGLFSGALKEKITASVLVEDENFSGQLSGRYGTLDNWIVENYNIANANDGNRQGLDNYNGTKGISLGVWEDRNNNQNGDLTNARIYRKVTLQKGKYYFGAAYNSLYGLNNEAFLFVSTNLYPTNEIPEKSLAYYQVNQGKEGNDLYGLYVDIEKETEVYIGWQANLNNGSDKQEFRAIKLGFYLIDEDTSPTVDKLKSNGWIKLEGIDPKMDYSQYYFAFFDRSSGLPIVAKPASGDKNWADTYAMCYSGTANANNDESAVWTIDAFDENDVGFAVGDKLKKVIITSLADTKRHFRTEGWSKMVWQTYSDFAKNNNYASDGNCSIAFLVPTYSPTDGWTFKNQTSNAFLGPWVDGAFEESMEFAANKNEKQASHVDIYAINRCKWMEQYEKLPEIKGEVVRNLSYLITNNSFERYDEGRKPIGWVTQGDGEVERGYLNGCDGTLYMNNWQYSGQLSNRSVSQKITQLPKGKYRLAVYRMSAGENAFLFANDEVQSLGSNGETGEDVSLDFELNETADVYIGIKLIGFTANNLKFDNFRLTYLGNTTSGPGTNIAPIQVSSTANSEIYNLLGQKLLKLQKGINIVHGKKIYLK